MTVDDMGGRADDGRRESLAAMIADDPGRLRRRSLSLGVAPDDADDVAQTALLRAWRSIEHLRSPGPGELCSWLDAIARNAAIDLARQQARRRPVALDDEAPDPRGVAETVEMRAALDGALGAIRALPESLREPLVLSIADGLTAPEIAERLGIAPAAVRQRLSRARRALAACREG